MIARERRHHRLLLRGWSQACVLLLLAVTTPTAAQDPRAGRRTYASICASCHGMNGHASLESAPSFARGDRLDKPNHVLVKSVREGVFRMPPWGGYLTDREIADAIAYARTLSGKPHNPSY